MDSGNPYEMLADLLEKEAVAVRNIESRANSALHEHGNDAMYRELMREKAMTLAGLAEQAKPMVDLLSEVDRIALGDRIARFSVSAGQSLELGSVFFMSALLYADDYQEGELNDLENIALVVRKMA